MRNSADLEIDVSICHFYVGDTHLHFYVEGIEPEPSSGRARRNYGFRRSSRRAKDAAGNRMRQAEGERGMGQAGRPQNVHPPNNPQSL